MAKPNLYEVLKLMLQERQKKDPDSSLRTFAKDLGISPSRLSLLLNDKIDLTRELLEKIQNGNSLNGDEKKNLDDCYDHYYSQKNVEPTRVLKQDEIHKLSGWETNAIMTYLDAEIGPNTLEGISKYFGISDDVVKQVLEALMALEMIDHTEGQYFLHAKKSLTKFKPDNQRFKYSFMEVCGRGVECMDWADEHLRDFFDSTFSVPVDQIPKLKKHIAKFVAEFDESTMHYKKGEVYRLNIQLFPLRDGKNQ